MRNHAYEQQHARTHVLVFDPGEEAVEGITSYAGQQGIEAGAVTALGALSSATVAYLDADARRYIDHEVPEQVEVASWVGTLTRQDGEPHLHAHVVLSRRDASTVGGHLKAATVRPTLEVVIVELPGRLDRRWNEEVGMATIHLEEPPDQESERGSP